MECNLQVDNIRETRQVGKFRMRFRKTITLYRVEFLPSATGGIHMVEKSLFVTFLVAASTLGLLVTEIASADPPQRAVRHPDAAPAETKESPSALPPGMWTLVFQDEFNGSKQDLDKTWNLRNKAADPPNLCSFSRENVDVNDGILRLQARKEKRGERDWTTAAMFTNRKFRYGYFECRYRYARATGTNNSFWMVPMNDSGWTTPTEPTKVKLRRDKEYHDISVRFEIDINEGHYPNELNTNIHNWSGKHQQHSQSMKVDGVNLAEQMHVFGLQWSEKELVWYFDGKEIRREKNVICYYEVPVWFSLTVLRWAGRVTDAIDGTSMDIDYVRVYQQQ